VASRPPRDAEAATPDPDPKPLPLLGVVADGLEHGGIHLAGAAHLDPARVLADRAALAVTEVAGDVEFDRRLGEREKARAHANLSLAAEDGGRERLHRPAEVGQRDVAIDRERFHLVED